MNLKTETFRWFLFSLFLIKMLFYIRTQSDGAPLFHLWLLMHCLLQPCTTPSYHNRCKILLWHPQYDTWWVHMALNKLSLQHSIPFFVSFDLLFNKNNNDCGRSQPHAITNICNIVFLKAQLVTPIKSTLWHRNWRIWNWKRFQWWATSKNMVSKASEFFSKFHILQWCTFKEAWGANVCERFSGSETVSNDEQWSNIAFPKSVTESGTVTFFNDWQ